MKTTGGCFCSEIRYEAEIDDNTMIICHCTDCQINSGTAYGVVVGVINNQFNLVKGKLSFFNKIADSGAKRGLAFCSNCGTRLFARPADDSKGFFWDTAWNCRPTGQFNTSKTGIYEFCIIMGL